MKKIGIFKIETSFNVTGRGIIALGQLIEGIPRLGTYISIHISAKEEMLKIIGIESGKPDKNDIIRFGLLLSINDPVLKKYIAENKLTEQVTNIFEKTEPLTSTNK